MSTSLWKKLPLVFPIDHQICFVRLVYSYTPFKATYHADSDIFTTDNGHSVPWYHISYWRPWTT